LLKQESFMRRRIVFASVVSAVTAVAMAGAVLAAGGGGFGTPGTTTFQDLNASAALTDSTGGFLYLDVDRGMQTFKLRGVTGPPVMVGPETVLSYYGFSQSTGYSFGCFVIPDSSFTVASNLSTASLNVDPTIETPCPGFLISASTGGRPGQSGPAPDAGGKGGGGGGGGNPGLTANLTWTSNGAVTSANFSEDARCQTAVAHAVGSSELTFGSVSGSVSALVDVSTQYAAINEFNTTEVITSTFSSACVGA
jgi:hypothetical protein